MGASVLWRIGGGGGGSSMLRNKAVNVENRNEGRKSEYLLLTV